MANDYGEDGDFKSRFNETLVRRIADGIYAEESAFNRDAFIAAVLEELFDLEMKDRAKLIATELNNALPGDLEHKLVVLQKTVGEEGGDDDFRGFDIWPLTQFVQMFGVDHFDTSMAALNKMTRVFSAEFAVRPFFMRYPERTMELMLAWTQDESEHVRRLVSEGSRPRLPWGIRLNQFIDSPRATFPLLERLKDDPSEYVRRSVANHLNDIAKDHPEIVVELTKNWMKNADTNRKKLIKHALRTLIKAGNPGALEVLGYRPDIDVSVINLEASEQVHMPGVLEFQFELVSHEPQNVPVIVDFVIHHVKKNGQRTPKVFKFKTTTLKAESTTNMRKAHKFKPISTRKYYSGEHLLEVTVNGQSLAEHAFHLEAQN